MSQPSEPVGKPNRLAQESSPYLRQHATNPVDWYPWGDEALARAKAEHKPILLSVGYSACHWCHVMAHESFEDPTVAALMNEYFVNVKVDREERPDLDQLYQGVVQLMGRGGGWPLTVFLAPDLRPFFGGTYFPPEDKFGMPGFAKLLKALHDAWLNKPEEVRSQAEQFEQGLQHLAAYGLDAPPSELEVKDIVAAGQKLDREIDRTHGGFGSAPKFPNPMNVSLLLRAHRRSGNGAMLAGVVLTLEKMAKGGLYDQLGGGFHRYSVDERWRVPHFEKMLYDNAQLLHLYAEAQQAAPRPLWRQVAVETVAYLEREMSAPQGGFFATQDADTEGEEGKFFVWTAAELDALLTAPQADAFKRRYAVTAEGNFENGRTVLEVGAELADVARAVGRPVEDVEADLTAARKTLFDAREKRVRPGRDEKILAGWNGLMIRGLAFASRAFGEPRWAERAKAAADFVLGTMWKDGRLFRSHQDGVNKIDGFMEDYGDVAAGLTALFQATFEPRYLEAAEALVARAVELFWDEGRQAYFSAPREQKDLICHAYALHDNAFPSGASTLVEAQLALAALTGKPAYLDQASKYLHKMRDEMARNPLAHGHLLLAADTQLEGAAELTVVGEGEGVAALRDAFNTLYAPTVALLVKEGSAPPAPVVAATLEGRTAVDGKAAAYVCRKFTCELPVTDPAVLTQRLNRMAAVKVMSFERPTPLRSAAPTPPPTKPTLS